MLFRTHVVFGLICYFLVNYFVEMPGFVLLFVLLGSVFVDVDSCSSRVGRKVWFLSWFLRHRGFFHSLIGALGFSLIVGVFSLWGGFGFFVGYISHLFLDSFTRMGLKMFWPSGFRVRGFVKSGSWVEDVLFVLFLGLDVWLVFNSLF
ncbi:MAG: metal-dependent hydrolase [archaeon]